MANAVDRLFDQVLANLSGKGIEDLADWPNVPVDEDDYDVLDRPPEDDDASLFPITDELLGERTIDTLLEGAFPPVGVSLEERDLIEGGIRKRGLDALAFYKSRRFINQRPFAGRWGIFYLESGLLHVATEIKLYYPGYSDPRRLAHQFLLRHEFFHYRCDLQTLALEAVRGKHLYIPLRRALFGRRNLFVEEAMANRAVYDWAKSSQAGIEEFALDFMSLQPGAYARFTEKRIHLNGEWLANTLDLSPPNCLPRSDIPEWADATPATLLRTSLCPQYIIYPRRLSSWLDPAWVPPPVLSIVDHRDVQKRLSGKYRSIAARWTSTKSKLLTERTRLGLNFKPWPKVGRDVYSVRIDDGFRAHLRNEGHGNWLAIALGTHTEMGHD
jgi:hypothetical protein